MSRQLLLLKELGQYHEEMVEKVNQFDWKSVGNIWQAMEARFAVLKTVPLTDLADNERAEALQLLENLLSRQKFIYGQAKSWMEQVHPLLDSFQRHPPISPDRSLPG